MKRIPLWLALALLCAACGNVETGAASATPQETPDGYDPEDPGDDPGGGSGETPSIGNGIGGFFDIARQRSNVPEYDQFMLSGFFPSPAWPPEMGALAALADHFPQMPFDSCGPIPASTIGGGGPEALGWLDAGDLTLAGPSGTDPVNELSVLGIVTPTLLTGRIRDALRVAERSLMVQKWQLSQLSAATSKEGAPAG